VDICGLTVEYLLFELNAAVSRMNIEPEKILIRDFTYNLPHHRIAGFPLPQRDQSKLLVYKNGKITDDQFLNISHYLPRATHLVLNNTRVIEARLLFQKPSGGTIEIFCLEPYQESMEQAMLQKESAVWKCLIGGASKWKPGQVLQKKIQPGDEALILSAKYLQKQEDFFLIQLSWQPAEISFVEILHAAGAIPLPPYIKRAAEKIDWERYQTIFGKEDGSVAAPTAALHFTQNVFNELKTSGIGIDYITLHVGAGTFKPVKTDNIADHQMHAEPFTVSKNFLERLIISEKIVPVGTTSLRSLESLHWLGIKLGNKDDVLELTQWEAYDLAEQYGDVSYQKSLQYFIDWMAFYSISEVHCRTSLLIVPGYQFKIPAGLVTNFHQPQSTLLLLVAAFIGEDWRKVYEHALQNDYRFLSYGDSSLLWRTPFPLQSKGEGLNLY